MSIGIVVATNDMILMVADGRQTDITDLSVLNDSTEKIVPIHSSLSVIEFGMAANTAAIVEQLRLSLSLPEDGEQVLAIIRDSVHLSGLSAVGMNYGSVNDRSSVKIGIIAAGIDQGGLYIGGAMFGHGMTEPDFQFLRPGLCEARYIILGGEEHGAQGMFASLALRALRASMGDPAGLLNMLQRAAKKTIRHVATLHPSVGGQVRYRVLAKDTPPRDGLL